jgi:pimeloyl-ACP methyl ester carboxylesterase
MVAHVARCLFIAWFLILATLLAVGLRFGWPVGVWIGLLLLVLGHPALMLVEFGLARRVGRRASGVRLSLGALARAWLGEWLMSTIVFGWRMPWRAQAWPDQLPPAARGRRGVVFVHGLLCNRGIWNPWLAQLTALDRAFVAVSLEPVFGEIDAYVDTVERAVRQVEAATGLAPIIVAHSMGGLVARAWLRWRRGRAEGGRQDPVARVITIGTPHRGTWLAALARSPNARQMRTGSAWMTALTGAETADHAQAFTCWWSDCDQIVFPAPTAVLAGSESQLLRDVGHVALTERAEIRAELQRRLEPGPGGPP